MMTTAINLFSYLVAGGILWFIFQGVKHFVDNEQEYSFLGAAGWNTKFIRYILLALVISCFLLLCVIAGEAFVSVFRFAFRIR